MKDSMPKWTLVFFFILVLTNTALHAINTIHFQEQRASMLKAFNECLEAVQECESK